MPSDHHIELTIHDFKVIYLLELTLWIFFLRQNSLPFSAFRNALLVGDGYPMQIVKCNYGLIFNIFQKFKIESLCKKTHFSFSLAHPCLHVKFRGPEITLKQLFQDNLPSLKSIGILQKLKEKINSFAPPQSVSTTH